MESMDTLIAEGAKLKEQEADIKARLADINKTLETMAEFCGKKTATIVGGGYRVKIQKRTNVRWDQAKLNEARQMMGNDEFFKAFTWRFEPKGARQLAEYFEATQEHNANIIKAAMTEKPGAPDVTYEPIEEEV